MRDVTRSADVRRHPSIRSTRWTRVVEDRDKATALARLQVQRPQSGRVLALRCCGEPPVAGRRGVRAWNLRNRTRGIEFEFGASASISPTRPPLPVDGDDQRRGDAAAYRSNGSRHRSQGICGVPAERRRFAELDGARQILPPCRSVFEGGPCGGPSAASPRARGQRGRKNDSCRPPARPTPRGRSLACPSTSRGSGNARSYACVPRSSRGGRKSSPRVSELRPHPSVQWQRCWLSRGAPPGRALKIRQGRADDEGFF